MKGYRNGGTMIMDTLSTNIDFSQFDTKDSFISYMKLLKNDFTFQRKHQEWVSQLATCFFPVLTRNLKCKVFDSEILVAELSKKQKEIYELCNIQVPKVYKT